MENFIIALTVVLYIIGASIARGLVMAIISYKEKVGDGNSYSADAPNFMPVLE